MGQKAIWRVDWIEQENSCSPAIFRRGYGTTRGHAIAFVRMLFRQNLGRIAYIGKASNGLDLDCTWGHQLRSKGGNNEGR